MKQLTHAEATRAWAVLKRIQNERQLTPAEAHLKAKALRVLDRPRIRGGFHGTRGAAEDTRGGSR